MALVSISISAFSGNEDVEKIMKQRDKTVEQAKVKCDIACRQADVEAIRKLVALQIKYTREGKQKDAKRVAEAARKLKKQLLTPRPDRIPSATNAPLRNKILKSSLDEQYPDGSFRAMGHHYCILPAKMSRPDGRNSCKIFKGHVLRIDTQEELKYFTKLAKEKKQAYWVDLDYDPGVDKWKTRKGDIKDIHPENTMKIPGMGASINPKDGFKAVKNADSRMLIANIVCEWDK